jgi:hypothetical protein
MTDAGSNAAAIAAAVPASIAASITATVREYGRGQTGQQSGRCRNGRFRSFHGCLPDATLNARIV